MNHKDNIKEALKVFAARGIIGFKSKDLKKIRSALGFGIRYL